MPPSGCGISSQEDTSLPAWLMSDPLKTCALPTWLDSRSATSSLASGSGPTLSDSQGGQTPGLSGQDPALVNLSPRLVKALGLMTSGTWWGDLQELVGEKLMPIMMKLTDVGIKVVDWISRNSDELQPYIIALGAAAVAFGVLNVVMSANPISLIIIGVAALAAGLIYAYQHSETFRTIVDAAFKAIGDMATWLWNNALQPLIKMFVEGLSAIIYWLGEMFRSLGNVPGFEWAKEAGDKMNKAAKEVNDFSKSIDKIPPKASVDITVTANYSQLQQTALAAARANIKLAGMPGYASGGRPQVGVPALFGEAGVEMWIPDTAGTVLNASQTAAAMNRGPRALDTGGAGGGNIYVQVSVQGDTDPDGAARRIEGLLVDLQTNRGGTLGFLPRA